MGASLNAMPRLQTPHCLNRPLDFHRRDLRGKASGPRSRDDEAGPRRRCSAMCTHAAEPSHSCSPTPFAETSRAVTAVAPGDRDASDRLRAGGERRSFG